MTNTDEVEGSFRLWSAEIFQGGATNIWRRGWGVTRCCQLQRKNYGPIFSLFPQLRFRQPGIVGQSSLAASWALASFLHLSSYHHATRRVQWPYPLGRPGENISQWSLALSALANESLSILHFCILLMSFVLLASLPTDVVCEISDWLW